MSVEVIVEAIKKNLVVAISAIVVCASMTVYVLHMDKKSDLDSEIEQIDIRISTMLKNIKNSAGLEEDIEIVEKQIEQLDERMFRTQELATNYNYFFNIESGTNVALSDLKQVGIVEGEVDPRKRKMPKPIVNSYVKIRYHVKATGKYGDLVKFMRTLEGGSSFYRLEKFRLSKSMAEGDEHLSMDVAFMMLGKKAS